MSKSLKRVSRALQEAGIASSPVEIGQATTAQMAADLIGCEVDQIAKSIIFRGDNAVHLGDVFNNGGYPFVDADSGGSLPGLIKFCEEVLLEINTGTVVIPGHGPVAGYEDLEDYIDMLSTIRDRIAALIEQGASLEEVVAARPTAEWDDVKGNPAGFINRSYTSMTR